MDEAKALRAETVVKAAPGQMSCDLAGEAAILNMATGIYYGLDPIGARVWELIQEPASISRLRDTLLEEYEVESAQVEADVKVLLADMASHGLVEVVS